MDNLLVEVRFVEDATRQSPGRLTGTLLTYGEMARDRAEKILDNALRWDETGIVIYEQHERTAPIVRAVPFLENRELRIDVALPNSTRGRDAAENVRTGLLTGLSVEMLKTSIVAAYVGGVREIRSALLAGAGLVDLAAYRNSTVEIRHSDGGVALPTAATLWL